MMDIGMSLIYYRMGKMMRYYLVIYQCLFRLEFISKPPYLCGIITFFQMMLFNFNCTDIKPVQSMYRIDIHNCDLAEM